VPDAAVRWGLALIVALGVGALAAARVRRWSNRAAVEAVRRLRARVDRYQRVSRRTIRAQLLEDPVVQHAMAEHAREQGTSERDCRARVERYLEEIVPHFNLLSYYRVGYNVARVLLHLLYRVSAVVRDGGRLERIPRRDVVVYLMNHRSNADYVVVAYVLAGSVSISYAVGEWARVWPLEWVFKSFGSYFVRRGYRVPLYHTVLRRYVQLITRNGVTQGIFLEGGLSRDGRLRPTKIGLLDSVLGTLAEPGFDRDVWLVPVAINYDRVLEDRVLIRELLDERAPGRLAQLAGVARYLIRNLARAATGQLQRYGRVAVVFGEPQSTRQWLADHEGLLQAPRPERLPLVQALADAMMARIAAIVPATPVPVVAAALLSFQDSVVEQRRVLERIDEYRRRLQEAGAQLVPRDLDAAALLDRAWRTLAMRRLAVREGGSLVVLPRERPLLEYYANSISHVLPEPPSPVSLRPTTDPDPSLPRLRAAGERSNSRTETA
jgi:glycerol-3-phosphate O-acyltransferase